MFGGRERFTGAQYLYFQDPLPAEGSAYGALKDLLLGSLDDEHGPRDHNE